MSDHRAVLVITGLPGTGKTTLARYLAQRYRAPLIAKDTIKEPLLDVLGAPDRARSRTLSDASFAVLFALAREQLRAGVGVLLEGNFRPAEHSAPLAHLVAIPPPAGITAGCAQVLCCADEATRSRRIAARAADPARHPGHRDAELAAAPPADAMLEIGGSRFVFTGFEASDWSALRAALDRWWASGDRGAERPDGGVGACVRPA